MKLTEAKKVRYEVLWNDDSNIEFFDTSAQAKSFIRKSLKSPEFISKYYQDEIKLSRVDILEDDYDIIERYDIINEFAEDFIPVEFKEYFYCDFGGNSFSEYKHNLENYFPIAWLDASGKLDDALNDQDDYYEFALFVTADYKNAKVAVLLENAEEFIELNKSMIDNMIQQGTFNI
jgi:hypothetical protein